jgi:hypothetical protein
MSLSKSKTEETRVAEPIVKETLHEHHVTEIQPVVHKEHRATKVHKRYDHVHKEGKDFGVQREDTAPKADEGIGSKIKHIFQPNSA